MLKFKEPNFLAVNGLRRVESHRPPHFEPVFFDLYVHIKVITDWIFENLEGRFYVGPHVSEKAVDRETTYGQYASNNTITYVAGFEEPSEASYFALMLGNIQKD